jgi:hypothetical protein
MFEEAVWYILLPLWSPDDFKLNPLLSTPQPHPGGGTEVTCEYMQWRCRNVNRHEHRSANAQAHRRGGYYTHQTNNPHSTFLAKICFSISLIFTQQTHL